VRWRLDVAALEQVIEPADPIPAIAVSLEQQVFSLPVRLMVVSGSHNVHIFPEPCFNHAFFEAPLIANFESWDLPLSHEPVDSELIYIQKTSDFLTGQ